MNRTSETPSPESKAAQERARKKVLSAAKKHKIEIDEDAQIARPVTSLRAASTKAGPRGGRKRGLTPMATEKQRAAARQNIKKAQQAARKKRTIANLPKSTRTALGKQGAKVAREKRGSQG